MRKLPRLIRHNLSRPIRAGHGTWIVMHGVMTADAGGGEESVALTGAVFAETNPVVPITGSAPATMIRELVS